MKTARVVSIAIVLALAACTDVHSPQDVIDDSSATTAPSAKPSAAPTSSAAQGATP